MPDDFQILREVLVGERSMPSNLNLLEESCHRRLLGAVRDFNSGKRTVGVGDIVGLVRHVLRFESERHNNMGQTMRVPNSPLWPGLSDWKRANIDVLNEGSQFYTIQAKLWQPNWLSGSQQYPPAKEAFGHVHKRAYLPVMGDPFLNQIGFEKYSSAGQRDAMRAVLTAPKGATLVVNLPTGSGKSLCGHLPALMRSKDLGVTVVVVPTTALCIDQERTLESIISHPTAYYGGNTKPELEERNRSIRDRIRNGTQRIVFTSPEGMLQGLCRPIYEAGENGFLRMLVVDEAHITDLWGDEFRSSFQEVAGMRRDLLRVCQKDPFITILLSATITEHSLSTLEVLFGQPGPFKMVSAVQLRPEPSYRFSLCDNNSVKEKRIFEAIHCLPRPLILYTTKVEDANVWARKIRELGNLRCGLITGETSSHTRSDLIGKWRQERLDLMVATSAFGLGVDQADVRSVIHACVPESIDRFYQEVGRGGRDGKASVSLTVSTLNDLKMARGLKNRKLISIEKGHARWEQLFFKKENVVGNSECYRIRVDEAPPYDIDMDSQRNMAWNVRTLTLMSRSGLIELDGEAPPSLKNAEDVNDDITEAVDVYQKSRIIRIKNEDHSSLDTWLNFVEPVRQATKEHTDRSIKLMVEALKGTRCMSDIFSDLYAIKRSEFQVLPFRACGGCSFCLKDKMKFSSPIRLPRKIPVWENGGIVSDEILKLCLGYDGFAAFYTPKDLEKKWNTQSNIEKIVKWLASNKLQNFVYSGETNQLNLLTLLQDYETFVFSEFSPLYMLRLPTVIIVSNGQTIKPDYLPRKIRNPVNLERILIFPETFRDPEAQHRLLKDVLAVPSYNISELCGRFAL